MRQGKGKLLGLKSRRKIEIVREWKKKEKTLSEKHSGKLFLTRRTLIIRGQTVIPRGILKIRQTWSEYIFSVVSNTEKAKRKHTSKREVGEREKKHYKCPKLREWKREPSVVSGVFHFKMGINNIGIEEEEEEVNRNTNTYVSRK